MPLISVIIPYYNGEKYINQCIESVLKQPFKDLEILLINDGSPSPLPMKLMNSVLNNNQIRYFEKENEGIGATRNYGISLAQGEYISCLDQDDMWVKDFLDCDVVSHLNGATDIISFDVFGCDENLKRAGLDAKLGGGGQ